MNVAKALTQPGQKLCALSAISTPSDRAAHPAQ